MIENMLTPEPPVKAFAPELMHVFEDRFMALDAPLPQMVEPGVFGESGQQHFFVGEIESPGVTRIKLHDIPAILRGHCCWNAVWPAG